MKDTLITTLVFAVTVAAIVYAVFAGSFIVGVFAFAGLVINFYSFVKE